MASSMSRSPTTLLSEAITGGMPEGTGLGVGVWEGGGGEGRPVAKPFPLVQRNLVPRAPPFSFPSLNGHSSTLLPRKSVCYQINFIRARPLLGLTLPFRRPFGLPDFSVRGTSPPSGNRHFLSSSSCCLHPAAGFRLPLSSQAVWL